MPGGAEPWVIRRGYRALYFRNANFGLAIVEVNVTTILKHPPGEVWTTIRDELPLIAQYLDDVSSIEPIERREHSDGTILVVNRWHAAPRLPAAVASLTRPEMFTWIDRAVWNEAASECGWTIESEYLGQRAVCAGNTGFQPAMGGRGTRITFAGRMILNDLPGGLANFERYLTMGVESVVNRIVTTNFQKLARAAGQVIESRN